MRWSCLLAAWLVLLPSASHAQRAKLFSAFASMAGHLPGRSELTKGVIVGIAGNFIYDKLKGDPAPPPPPNDPPKPSIGINIVSPPQTCPAGCNTIQKRIEEINRDVDTRIALIPNSQLLRPNPNGGSLPPGIYHPAPITAEDLQCIPGIDPNEALRRASILDNGIKLNRRDAPSAATCYYEAATHNIVLAQYALGDMLAHGDTGVRSDVGAALGWLEPAALAGFVPAQTYLGYLYETDAVYRDLARSVEWYFAAARAGDALAQYELARLDFLGIGVPANHVLAFNWLNVAVMGGYPPARDAIKTLLDTASELAQAYNDPAAHHIWGLAYESGVPNLVPVDYRRAYIAYMRAAGAGSVVVRQDIQRLCTWQRAACQ
jgi:Sel1 repeat